MSLPSAEALAIQAVLIQVLHNQVALFKTVQLQLLPAEVVAPAEVVVAEVEAPVAQEDLEAEPLQELVAQASATR
jgi:hypothetical protein